MKAKQDRSDSATVEVKQVTPNGRILYDADSIFKTEAARHHINTLREVDVARTEKKDQAEKPGR